MDATTYPYQISVGRRWPVRHHSGLSIERTKRPKWWKPRHPRRRRYFVSGLGANEWGRLTGWSTSTWHQEVVREANRRWRHQSKQRLRQGDYDSRPYIGVDWVW